MFVDAATIFIGQDLDDASLHDVTKFASVDVSPSANMLEPIWCGYNGAGMDSVYLSIWHNLVKSGFVMQRPIELNVLHTVILVENPQA